MQFMEVGHWGHMAGWKRVQLGSGEGMDKTQSRGMRRAESISSKRCVNPQASPPTLAGLTWRWAGVTPEPLSQKCRTIHPAHPVTQPVPPLSILASDSMTQHSFSFSLSC